MVHICISIFQPGFICVGMAPVVDGPGGFMPQKPVFQRMDGDVMQGPIIAGINREDGSLFAPLSMYQQQSYAAKSYAYHGRGAVDSKAVVTSYGHERS